MDHSGDQNSYKSTRAGEFMGAVTKLMKEIGTFIRCGRVDIHRDQVIVERFNRTLAERLFGHQYAVEMRLSKGQTIRKLMGGRAKYKKKIRAREN